jgi:ligand-binding SRPBCC domain-containing protein
MPTFIKSVLIDAPVNVVFGFHEREDALLLLSPPFPKVRIVARSGGIRTGARVAIHVAGIDWVAVHTAYEHNLLFVDEQIRGPFARWTHRHEFEDDGGMTRLTDRLVFQLRGGPLIDSLFGWLVRLALHTLFNHRHRVTREYCEKLAIASRPVAGGLPGSKNG